MAQITARLQGMEDKTAENNVLLKEIARDIGAANIASATLGAQVTAINVTIGDIKTSNAEQWAAINSVRRLVWTGFGIFTALATVAGLFATLAK
ncbi:MAG: hypothetical protein AB7E47_03255 [Desulfovibrionaceae bacterium]